MNTVFLPPEPQPELSGKHMNSISKSLSPQMIAPTPAANADHVGERAAAAAAAGAATQTAGGWDAYEVWRRLIKDARDRREHRE